MEDLELLDFGDADNVMPFLEGEGNALLIFLKERMGDHEIRGMDHVVVNIVEIRGDE